MSSCMERILRKLFDTTRYDRNGMCAKRDANEMGARARTLLIRLLVRNKCVYINDRYCDTISYCIQSGGAQREPFEYQVMHL